MLRKGIVVATHPEDHSVDLVMSDTGARLTGVQVSTPSGSTRSGRIDMPHVPEKSDKWDIRTQTEQEQIALVGDVNGFPVVTGFLYPQISQMTFSDPNLRVDRHQSDVMSTIDGDGNFQFTHPSGLFVRVGETPEKVDVAGKNTDKSLAINRNTGRRVDVRLSLAGNTVELTFTKDGAVTLKLDQDLTIQAEGNVAVSAQGSMSFDAQGAITMRSPAGITLDAPVAENPNGDVVASNISLVNHSNSGVVPGGGLSGPPVP